MTKEVRHLWYDFLKNYTIQFNLQKVISSYVDDSYCHKAKLIVELDGSQHFKDIGCINDTVRTIYMNNLGLDVMLISNNEIWTNFPGVCKTIGQIVQTITSLHQSARG